MFEEGRLRRFVIRRRLSALHALQAPFHSLLQDVKHFNNTIRPMYAVFFYTVFVKLLKWKNIFRTTEFNYR